MLIPGFPICYDFVSVFYMWLIVVLRERIVYLQACNEFAKLNWYFEYENKKNTKKNPKYIERANDLNT